MTDRIEHVQELRAGTDVFASRGFAYVKVTKSGAVKGLRLPIKSSGVTEVIERIRQNEPKPPTKPLTVLGDSPEGRALGLRREEKKVVTAPDFTDADYLKARDKYEQELTLEIVIQGLDIPLKDETGQVVETRDQKIAVLKSLGLSIQQFQDIVNAVNELTAMTEKDREDFFGTPSGSGVAVQNP